VFVETGTFMGDGILKAVWVGFEQIYSIERSDYYYERAIESFKDFPNVCIIHGDSGIELEKLLKEINEPVTFWLDAHFSEQGTYEGDSPLFCELRTIFNHHIKNHVILVDDIADHVENNILICRL
jgi:hypothetical protein